MDRWSGLRATGDILWRAFSLTYEIKDKPMGRIRVVGGHEFFSGPIPNDYFGDWEHSHHSTTVLNPAESDRLVVGAFTVKFLQPFLSFRLFRYDTKLEQRADLETKWWPTQAKSRMAIVLAVTVTSDPPPMSRWIARGYVIETDSREPFRELTESEASQLASTPGTASLPPQ